MGAAGFFASRNKHLMLQIFFNCSIGFLLREEVEKNNTGLLKQCSFCTAMCIKISSPGLLVALFVLFLLRSSHVGGHNLQILMYSAAFYCCTFGVGVICSYMQMNQWKALLVFSSVLECFLAVSRGE